MSQSARTPFDAASFQAFLDELDAATPPITYYWTPEKEVAAQWIVDRIAPGTRGVDIGGTEWLCEALAAKGCDVTFFDAGKPQRYPQAIQDDMLNVSRHFAPQSLDFIATRHTLEHSLAPLYQLWCYNRLLNDDGRLLVVVPTHAKEWVWLGTHYNCLPRENWLMLFYRAGFKVLAADAGSWKPDDPRFIEYRFELGIASRELRLRDFPLRPIPAN